MDLCSNESQQDLPLPSTVPSSSAGSIDNHRSASGTADDNNVSRTVQDDANESSNLVEDPGEKLPWFKGFSVQKDGQKLKGEALLEYLDIMESEYGTSLKDLTLREFSEFLEEKAISSVKNHFREWEEKEIDFLKKAGIYDHLK